MTPATCQHDRPHPRRKQRHSDRRLHRVVLEEHQIRFDRDQLASHRLHERARVATCARDERGARVVGLVAREVHERSRRFSDRPHLVIRRHTDDLERGSVHGANANPLSDRRLARPVPPCHRVVDDDDARRGGGVALVEVAALKEAHAHRLEIVVTDAGHVDRGAAVVSREDASIDEESLRMDVRRERQALDERSGRDAGERPQPRERVPIELRAPGRRVTVHRQIDGRDRQTVACRSRRRRRAPPRSCAREGLRRRAARSRPPPPRRPVPCGDRSARGPVPPQRRSSAPSPGPAAWTAAPARGRRWRRSGAR